MTQLGTQKRPLRIAIIGTGPSGYYSADALFKSNITINIDLFDRLATPFGLLRNGVAPDHQQMKSIRNYYNRIQEKNTTNIEFFGNVEIGKDLSINELKQHYDSIIYAYGSESDKKINLPNEEIPGCYAAREFVGWYNGHPDYKDYQFDLSHHTVSVIGMGNIAMDIARILAKTPQELALSDIAKHAQIALKNSQVRTIKLFARRGPIQAAFTHLECKELGELQNCNIIINPKDLCLTKSDELELKENNKAQKNFKILQEHAHTAQPQKDKTIELYFKHSLTEIIGQKKLSHIKLNQATLSGPPFKQKLIPGDQHKTVTCGLLFKSIGYKGLPIAGLPHFDDKKGIIPNTKGRLLTTNKAPLYGMYTVGWIKRGPTGVIGSNKPCAAETINTLLNDFHNNKIIPCLTPSSTAIKKRLKERNIPYINYKEWTKIDKEEEKRGKKTGKPREKFVSTEEILMYLKKEKNKNGTH